MKIFSGVSQRTTTTTYSPSLARHSHTWHTHGPGRSHASLAPALDPATRLNRACVGSARRDGGGGNACRVEGKGNMRAILFLSIIIKVIIPKVPGSNPTYPRRTLRAFLAFGDLNDAKY